MTSTPLVQIHKLKKHFPFQKSFLRAIDDISLDIFAGETIGLVGESGSGKSTLGKILIRLETPSDGSAYFGSYNLHQLQSKEKKGLCRSMQMIFQDPYSSLNPRMTVAEILKEPFKIHSLQEKLEEEISSLLSLVGLNDSFLNRFPHELSGGQRQRIGIARALALRPEFIVCDEPVSALDVSIQAQIINLLKDLQIKLNLTYLFIAHDLGIVRYISSRVAVMYLGRLMELAKTEELYQKPLHPYTKILLASIPIPDPKLEKNRLKVLLPGEISSPIGPSKGCSFSARCPHAESICHQIRPKWKEVSPGHFVACHKVAPSI